MAVTVHEAFMPLTGWRYTTMGVCHRAQLYALLCETDLVIATCRERAEQIVPFTGKRVTRANIPVGSNLDAPVDRARVGALRTRVGGGRNVPIVATFGNDHASRLMPRVELALKSLAAMIGDYVVWNLGARPPRLTVPKGVVVFTPGRLTASDLVTHLTSADLVLLPYVNGAITNKTTLMAALQHRCAVLSTLGPSTDAVLIDPGLRLINVDDPEAYAAEAVRLMANDDERGLLATRGHELYEREFSWDTIGAKTLEVLDSHTQGSRPQRGTARVRIARPRP